MYTNNNEDYNIVLLDGTTGTISPSSIDFQDIDDFIGDVVTVKTADENGNEIEIEGILDTIL